LRVVLTPPNEIELWVSDEKGWAVVKVEIEEESRVKDHINVCIEGNVKEFQLNETEEATDILVSPDYGGQIDLKRCYVVLPWARISLAGR
jgi:hypothetical protein